MRLSPLLLPLVLAVACAPLHAQEPAGGEREPAAPNDPQAALADGPAQGATIPLDEIRRYVAVYNMVREAYVEPVDDDRLMASAIRGLLRDLDPHSAYLEQGDSADLIERTRGAYEGIGVELVRQPDDTLRIIAPIDGSPAARAGIKAGDVIVAVDGTPVAGADPESEPLRGPPGSEVKLTVLRESEEEPLEITVVRDVIRVASVRGRLLEPGYGYVRISMFQADTGADFARELDRLAAEPGDLHGVVIDLRSNPGGLLTTAVQVADELLDQGTIVSTRGRLAISDTTFTATPGDRLRGAPVVVLVDAGSASAAEVLAGALRDNDRARVVGSRTFGKGSVQTALPLDNGDTVKLTTARYYTPSGKSIQALGITPDVVLQPAGEEDGGGPALVSEAALAGHLGAEGEVGTELDPGDVLEGQAPIDAALAELKRMGAVAHAQGRAPRG